MEVLTQEPLIKAAGRPFLDREGWSCVPTCALLHLLLILQSECESLALLQGIRLHDPLYHWAAVHWADVPGVGVHIAFSPPFLMTVRIGAIPSELSSLVRQRATVRSRPPEYLQRLLQRRQGTNREPGAMQN